MARDDFRDLYQDLLIDHSRERHGYGVLEDPSAESHQRNRSCGDELTLRVRAEDGTVTAVSWTGQGCAISQASASMLCDLVDGLTPAECRQRVVRFRTMLQSRGKDDGDDDVLGDAIALAGVSKYPPRINCAMLAWVGLEDALSQLAGSVPTGSVPTGSVPTGPATPITSENTR